MYYEQYTMGYTNIQFGYTDIQMVLKVDNIFRIVYTVEHVYRVQGMFVQEKKAQ